MGNFIVLDGYQNGDLRRSPDTYSQEIFIDGKWVEYCGIEDNWDGELRRIDE